jgi:hypothetical protein
MRIRFGFSGLVNIQRQLGNIRREPSRLVAPDERLIW